MTQIDQLWCHFCYLKMHFCASSDKKTLLICASPKVSPLVEVFRKYYGKSAPKSRVIISEYRLMLYHMQNHCKYFIRNLCCLSQTFLTQSRRCSAPLTVNGVSLPYTKHATCIKNMSHTATVSHHLDIQTSKCSSLKRSVMPGANLTLIIGNLSLEWTVAGDKLRRFKFTTLIKIDYPTLATSQQNGCVWPALLRILTICSSSGLINRWAGEPQKAWGISQTFRLDSDEFE